MSRLYVFIDLKLAHTIFEHLIILAMIRKDEPTCEWKNPTPLYILIYFAINSVARKLLRSAREEFMAVTIKEIYFTKETNEIIQISSRHQIKITIFKNK